MRILILVLAGVLAAGLASSWWRGRRRQSAAVGAESARAERAEQPRDPEAHEPSPMPPGAYDAASADLADPVPLPLDDALAALARRYAAADPRERTALRRAIGSDEMYVVLTFARRAAVFGIREGDPGRVRDALTAVAMIERDRVDFRDVLTAIALLHHAAERTGGNGDTLVRQAAALADPGTAELLAGFAARPSAGKHVRDVWGFAEVQSAGGPGFVQWGFAPFAPTRDLSVIVRDLAAMLAADRYEPALVILGTDLPPVWLQPGGQALRDAMERIRAGASLSGKLRPDAHPNARAQQLTIFLVEAADEADARTLLQVAGNGARRDHALAAAAEGPIFCLVIARGLGEGVPAYETQESLARFGPRIREILRRHRG